MKRSWIEFGKRRIKGGLSRMRKGKRLSCTGHGNKIGKTEKLRSNKIRKKTVDNHQMVN